MVELLFSLSIVILSQAATLIRYAEASSLAICFWRLAIAALCLAPLAFRARKASTLTLQPRDMTQLVLAGVFLFAHFYSFFRSVQETTIANSTIVFSINPITTALGAYWFFHERITLHLALACAIGFAGILVLFGENFASQLAGGDLAGLSGNIWGALSAGFFSGYILAGKALRRKLPNSIFAFSTYAQTALYAGFAMLLTGVPFLSYTPVTWAMFVALAIFPTLLGHALFTYCLNFLNVNFMSCMTLVEPVLAAVVAHWLFAERFSPWSAFGFFLTCVAVVVLYWETLQGLFRRKVGA